ncbi:hypothetical protein NQD34_003151 [Periophthalmus magnuspinnatus]|nr:hypothetical protein NQD34_003151 [Periophthalmus magnuspinnatus]
MVVLLCYRRFRLFLLRMWRWARSRSFLDGVKHVSSWPWFYWVKVFLGFVPLLAIRYWFKHRDQNESDEEKNTFSSEVDFFTDDESSEETSTPRAQNGPRAQDGPQDRPTRPPDGPQVSPRAQDRPGAQNGPRAQDRPRAQDGPRAQVSPRAQDRPGAQDGPRAQDSPRALTQDHSSVRRYRPPEHPLTCEYDSTWDTDSDDSEEKVQEESEEMVQEEQSERTNRFNKVSNRQSINFERFQAAARDLQNYRRDYPIKPRRHWGFQESKTKDEHPNLDFYLGARPSSPDGLFIGDFHTLWRGSYDILESVHSYIQWLFPLQEPGVNPEAFTLTKEEIVEFCQNETAKKHLLESYKLMLDFYGIELCDEETGEVKRAQNWKDRFTNLNRNTHNNLRITRILKCLGTLGFTHYQAPLVRFFLEETLVNGELQRVKDSVLNYFLFTVRDKKQRRNLLEYAYRNFYKREEFFWCPKKIQMKWEKQKMKTDPPL